MGLKKQTSEVQLDSESSDEEVNLKQMKKKSQDKSQFGFKSSTTYIRNSVYVINLIVVVVFFCSSIFAYSTRTDVIFPERSAPKYVFDVI